MLTLPEIIRRTPDTRKVASKYVRLEKVIKGYNDIGQAFIAAQSYSTHRFDPTIKKWKPVTSKTKYVTVVTFLNRKLQCKVSCSCGDFTYRAEVALHRKGAADIEYSNGAPPIITNPRLRAFGCKHLVKLYETKIKPQLKPAKK